MKKKNDCLSCIYRPFCIDLIAKWFHDFNISCTFLLASPSLDDISVIHSRTLIWRKTRRISKHNTASFCVTMKRSSDFRNYDSSSGPSGSSWRPMDSPKRLSCHARNYVSSPFPQFRKPQVVRFCSSVNYHQFNSISSNPDNWVLLHQCRPRVSRRQVTDEILSATKGPGNEGQNQDNSIAI